MATKADVKTDGAGIICPELEHDLRFSGRGETIDVLIELVTTLERARAWVGGYGHTQAEKLAIIDEALAKARGEA